jgi:hypothetical protein
MSKFKKALATTVAAAAMVAVTAGVADTHGLSVASGKSPAVSNTFVVLADGGNNGTGPNTAGGS